ncbi:hypothetical protein BDV98DRAFT_64008 [Pterulicium gracile]|uniref:Uncharacterized protein n=1 Tax=Pterulicium gracile TaxID=1884261 RepID=A0A5C3QI82_9AGAR|nr:hypothetical protein BDV98DRAFT_64008 [Pterula gracilis]
MHTEITDDFQTLTLVHLGYVSRRCITSGSTLSRVAPSPRRQHKSPSHTHLTISLSNTRPASSTSRQPSLSSHIPRPRQRLSPETLTWLGFFRHRPSGKWYQLSKEAAPKPRALHSFSSTDYYVVTIGSRVGIFDQYSNVGTLVQVPHGFQEKASSWDAALDKHKRAYRAGVVQVALEASEDELCSVDTG